MVFSSLLFIFLFLVTNLIVYTLVDKKYKNPVLLGFSLVFYAWGGPQYLILLLLETFISWICAVYIEKEPQRKKLWMVLESAALIGLLAVFKYADFVLGNIQNLTGWPKSLPGILLPIGISFYTFQLLSYVIDVYKGQVHAQPKYWKLLLYSSLFHQCIAGPIVRYETVADEIDNRIVNMNDIYYGIRRFSIGLAKKAILANGCAQIADTLLPFDNAA